MKHINWLSVGLILAVSTVACSQPITEFRVKVGDVLERLKF